MLLGMPQMRNNMVTSVNGNKLDVGIKPKISLFFVDCCGMKQWFFLNNWCRVSSGKKRCYAKYKIITSTLLWKCGHNLPSFVKYLVKEVFGVVH
jgi:hypothetical protein